VRPCLKGSTISFVGEVLHTLRILLLLLTPCSKVHVRLVLRNLLEVSASKFEIIRYWPSRLQAQNYTENFSFFSWNSYLFSTVSVLPLQEREVFHSGLQCIRLKICRILRSLDQMRKLPKVARKQTKAYRQEQKGWGWLGSLQTSLRSATSYETYLCSQWIVLNIKVKLYLWMNEWMNKRTKKWINKQILLHKYLRVVEV